MGVKKNKGGGVRNSGPTSVGKSKAPCDPKKKIQN